jgi:nucleoside-diphosphate-sugar epimerase
MRRVVVTGGGGFVGSAIVRRLLTMGDRVTVVGRSRYPELAALGVTCLQGDIADQDFMDLACKNTDLLFHVAAKAGIWGRWQDYVRTNVHGTVACIKSCQKNNVPAFVYTSTPSVVFDRHDLEGADERTPYAKKSLCHYAMSKIIAEKLVLQANSATLSTTAIRPHLIWGPGDPHLIPRLLDRGQRKKLKIVGSGANRVDITYIDNVVQAHLLAADNLLGTGSAAGRAFFIGQEKPVILWDWINTLFVETGIEQVRKRVPFMFAYLAGGLFELIYRGLKRTVEPPMTRFVALQLSKSHWFNHGAAEEVLGYQPEVSTREGMKRLLRYCRNGS